MYTDDNIEPKVYVFQEGSRVSIPSFINNAPSNGSKWFKRVSKKKEDQSKCGNIEEYTGEKREDNAYRINMAYKSFDKINNAIKQRIVDTELNTKSGSGASIGTYGINFVMTPMHVFLDQERLTEEIMDFVTQKINTSPHYRSLAMVLENKQETIGDILNTISSGYIHSGSSTSLIIIKTSDKQRDAFIPFCKDFHEIGRNGKYTYYAAIVESRNIEDVKNTCDDFDTPRGFLFDDIIMSISSVMSYCYQLYTSDGSSSQEILDNGANLLKKTGTCKEVILDISKSAESISKYMNNILKNIRKITGKYTSSDDIKKEIEKADEKRIEAIREFDEYIKKLTESEDPSDEETNKLTDAIINHTAELDAISQKIGDYGEVHLLLERLSVIENYDPDKNNNTYGYAIYDTKLFIEYMSDNPHLPYRLETITTAESIEEMAGDFAISVISDIVLLSEALNIRNVAVVKNTDGNEYLLFESIRFSDSGTYQIGIHTSKDQMDDGDSDYAVVDIIVLPNKDEEIFDYTGLLKEQYYFYGESMYSILKRSSLRLGPNPPDTKRIWLVIEDSSINVYMNQPYDDSGTYKIGRDKLGTKAYSFIDKYLSIMVSKAMRMSGASGNASGHNSLVSPLSSSSSSESNSDNKKRLRPDMLVSGYDQEEEEEDNEDPMSNKKRKIDNDISKLSRFVLNKYSPLVDKRCYTKEISPNQMALYEDVDDTKLAEEISKYENILRKGFRGVICCIDANLKSTDNKLDWWKCFNVSGVTRLTYATEEHNTVVPSVSYGSNISPGDLQKSEIKTRMDSIYWTALMLTEDITESSISSRNNFNIGLLSTKPLSEANVMDVERSKIRLNLPSTDVPGTVVFVLWGKLSYNSMGVSDHVISNASVKRLEKARASGQYSDSVMQVDNVIVMVHTVHFKKNKGDSLVDASDNVFRASNYMYSPSNSANVRIYAKNNIKNHDSGMDVDMDVYETMVLSASNLATKAMQKDAVLALTKSTTTLLDRKKRHDEWFCDKWDSNLNGRVISMYASDLCSYISERVRNMLMESRDEALKKYRNAAIDKISEWNSLVPHNAIAKIIGIGSASDPLVYATLDIMRQDVLTIKNTGDAFFDSLGQIYIDTCTSARMKAQANIIRETMMSVCHQSKPMPARSCSELSKQSTEKLEEMCIKYNINGNEHLKVEYSKVTSWHLANVTRVLPYQYNTLLQNKPLVDTFRQIQEGLLFGSQTHNNRTGLKRNKATDIVRGVRAVIDSMIRNRSLTYNDKERIMSSLDKEAVYYCMHDAFGIFSLYRNSAKLVASGCYEKLPILTRCSTVADVLSDLTIAENILKGQIWATSLDHITLVYVYCAMLFAIKTISNFFGSKYNVQVNRLPITIKDEYDAYKTRLNDLLSSKPSSWNTTGPIKYLIEGYNEFIMKIVPASEKNIIASALDNNTRDHPTQPTISSGDHDLFTNSLRSKDNIVDMYKRYINNLSVANILYNDFGSGNPQRFIVLVALMNRFTADVCDGFMGCLTPKPGESFDEFDNRSSVDANTSNKLYGVNPELDGYHKEFMNAFNARNYRACIDAEIKYNSYISRRFGVQDIHIHNTDINAMVEVMNALSRRYYNALIKKKTNQTDYDKSLNSYTVFDRESTNPLIPELNYYYSQKPSIYTGLIDSSNISTNGSGDIQDASLFMFDDLLLRAKLIDINLSVDPQSQTAQSAQNLTLVTQQQQQQQQRPQSQLYTSGSPLSGFSFPQAPLSFIPTRVNTSNNNNNNNIISTEYESDTDDQTEVSWFNIDTDTLINDAREFSKTNGQQFDRNNQKLTIINDSTSKYNSNNEASTSYQQQGNNLQSVASTSKAADIGNESETRKVKGKEPEKHVETLEKYKIRNRINHDDDLMTAGIGYGYFDESNTGSQTIGTSTTLSTSSSFNGNQRTTKNSSTLRHIGNTKRTDNKNSKSSDSTYFSYFK